MLKSLPGPVRGAFSLSLYSFNTVFWSMPIFITAFLKLLIPVRGWRKLCDKILNGIAHKWIAVNNFTQRVFCDIRWHVFGLDSLKTGDWYLVVANHQSWVDILVLQKIFHKKIPFLKFFLKKELFWIPILGQAWWALDFPFMKRYSMSYIKKHPHLAGRDLEITKKACEKFKTIPVSVMNFVEGTRFTKEKRKKQQSPHKNLLRPKAGGIGFTLAAMGDHLNNFLDVTIAYPGGARTFWDFLCGNVKDIRVQVRSLPITPEMLGDYFNDRQFRQTFQRWLNTLWEQKDRCIEELLSAPLPDAAAATDVTPCFIEPMPVLNLVMLPEKSSPLTP